MKKLLLIVLLTQGCASLTKTDTHPGLTYWDLVHVGGPVLGTSQKEYLDALAKYCSHPSYKNASKCKITLTEEEKLEIDYYLIYGDK